MEGDIRRAGLGLAAEDRDALGTAVPPGLPVFSEISRADQPRSRCSVMISR